MGFTSWSLSGTAFGAVPVFLQHGSLGRITAASAKAAGFLRI
jgi:hypothetical protein